MLICCCCRCCRESLNSYQWVASVAVHGPLLRGRGTGSCQSSVTRPMACDVGNDWVTRSTTEHQPSLRLHRSTRQSHTPGYGCATICVLYL